MLNRRNLDMLRKMSELYDSYSIPVSDRHVLTSIFSLYVYNNGQRVDVDSDVIIKEVSDVFADSGIKDQTYEAMLSLVKGTVERTGTLDKAFVDGLISYVEYFLEAVHVDPSFDFLGSLYGTFSKYSSSDRRNLGIVLTPHHLSEFINEALGVRTGDVVIDTCSGSGVFLNSAISRGAKVAGSEQQDFMYLMTLTNAIIRDVDVSRLYYGSAFDHSLDGEADFAIINPPFSLKTKGHSELDFALDALKKVKDGGKLAVVIPVSVALQTNKELMKDILSIAKLDAVFSLPDDIFFPVGTVTALMIFEKGAEHTGSTYFGYYKDDGFVKTRNYGRIDDNRTFEREIFNKWLSFYKDRKDEPGFSVNHEVGIGDEWVAEAYMETDYSTLTDEDFEKEIRKYMAYLLENDLIEEGKEGENNA